MYGYVYVTTNLVNGKQYIGQHKGKFTSKYLGSGKYITNAIRKYGFNNFKVELLECANSKDELNVLERYYIALAGANKDRSRFYNITRGGEGVCLPGELNPMFGKHYAPWNTGKKLPERYSRKGERANMFGKHHSEHSRKLISLAQIGKTMSPESRAKMSASKMGHGFTEEAKKKISATLTG